MAGVHAVFIIRMDIRPVNEVSTAAFIPRARRRSRHHFDDLTSVLFARLPPSVFVCPPYTTVSILREWGRRCYFSTSFILRPLHPTSLRRSTWLLQLAGAKSRTYAPDGTCTRLSVLRIAGYGTAVLP